MKKLLLLSFFPLLSFAQGKVVEAKDSKNSPNDPRAILVYQTQIEDLKKSANKFLGGSEGLYKNTFSAEWAYRAVSKTERQAFFDKVSSNMSPELQKQLAVNLDELNQVIAPKINLYKPNSADFQHKNSEFEGLLKAQVLPHVTIKKSGLSSSDWKVINKPNGTPDYRFKDGTIWIKDSKADHPFCEVIYYRITQQYDINKYGESVVSNGTPYLCGCE